MVDGAVGCGHLFALGHTSQLSCPASSEPYDKRVGKDCYREYAAAAQLNPPRRPLGRAGGNAARATNR